MEIARAAGELFVKHGLRGTRAEDIAVAAGVAPRTFYRYFATKEEAVAPLYSAGARLWAEAVLSAPPNLSVPDALAHGVRHTFTPGAGVSTASWSWVRTLIRLADSDAGLRRVWAEVCHSSERRLGEVLAVRVGGAADVRLVAAVASAAVRSAVEAWAAGEVEGEEPVGLALRNLGVVGGVLG
ncbi:TetR family transcriptional regulator [Streptomyces sp. SID13726]|uniref:TetR/AcrR family transcriptional regulator n=1 Tax=Streptomyces sp. SID13726 TaxID=2706058 RepID=UPI0013B7D926|nr:TetR family transcriptional regulator [Streptomyces sp. SID13726]NEB05100.1 TetR family transcriptional regulator [Streptomyces sp. SID13726]